MPRFSFASLRTRIICLVFVCLVPALGLTLYTDFEERQLEKDKAQQNVLRLTRLAASREERLIEGVRQLLIALSELPEVRDGDRAECSRLFGRLLKHFPSYANVAAVDLDGDVFCSGVPLKASVNLAALEWFQRVIKKRHFTIGSYEIGRISGKPGIAFSYPVLDDTTGEVQAVVYTLLNLVWFNQVAVEIELPEGAALNVIDRNGRILVRYPNPEKWVGKYLPNTPIIKAMLTQGEGVREFQGLDGVLRLYAFTPLGEAVDADIYLAIGIEANNPYTEANRQLTRNLVGLGLVTVLAIAIAWRGSDMFLIRPVEALVSVAKRIAAGNLSTRTNLAQAPEEISHLAQSFDTMAESLESQLAEYQRVEAEIRQLNETLEQRVLERTAQLEAVNKELEAFSYSVSHDLRTPLRHIKGFVDALAQQLQRSGATADSKVAHYIEVIQDSSQKMGQLIDGLLTLSRVGRQPLASQPVNLRQLVDAAIAIVMSQTQTSADRPIEFIIGQLPTAIGDPTLLQQVFTNLIDNAVKFSRVSNPAKIEIGTLPDSTVFVKDNGVGFRMEYAEQVFGAFQRLHSQREFKGTGIGLAIVQRIIHRHGGTIWAESQPKQGATFYFQLKQLSQS